MIELKYLEIEMWLKYNLVHFLYNVEIKPFKEDSY